MNLRLLRQVLVIGLIVLAACAGWGWLSRRCRTGGDAGGMAVGGDPSPPAADLEHRIAAFCGDCHAVPQPASFPRDAWHDEVRQGYVFYARSGRTDLDPPSLGETVAYFRARAAARVQFPQPAEATTPLGLTFHQEQISEHPQAGIPPAVSHLKWCRLRKDQAAFLVACDMRRGTVTALDLARLDRSIQVLASLDNPCHVEPCDLDGDGHMDLLVADLGGFLPDDHQHGRVVWLRQDGANRSFEVRVIAEGLGRVVDVRPADFDSDGDLDLVVAEFGMYRTGGIWLLKNVAAAGDAPQFERHLLDGRPGSIHVPVHDWNGDGREDFLALISQEYESVEIFSNLGRGHFRRRPLWRAPDLTFGSSGVELADLDGDGDLDILFTNGDAFDNMYATPWHGIQWLENVDGRQFTYHLLAAMTGAYRALAGDLDGDGDLDIVAVSWLPSQVMPAELRDASLPSVVCLEQIAPGRFAYHALDRGQTIHAACELGDFDGDGDLDLAVGSHVPHTRGVSHWLTIWWNQRIGRK